MSTFRSGSRLRAKRLQRAWFAFADKSAFLRKLFLLRKAYLIKHRATHYSQWGEDVVLEGFMAKGPPPEQGCYIDVGCFHPKKYSNTYRLYRQGWHGINIDVDPIKRDVFELARRGDENLCCAVGDAPGRATLYSFGHYSVLSTLDAATAAEYMKLGYECSESQIQVRTLTEIFEASRFRERRIALLSIDVEGHEEAVLRSLDFARYRPALILVETHAPTLARMQQEGKYRLLTGELGYELVNWTGLTAFFRDAAATP